MIQIAFRNAFPKRNYTGVEYSDYRRYKEHLAKDFGEKCGYTNCGHFWFGGKRTFQIDHFKPISHHPELKTKYHNLVYSCSYVNRAKSNDLGDFLDPCDVDYNLHFYRDEQGFIFPKGDSETAKYMYKKLKLYLRRYSIIWMLEQLDEKMSELRVLIESTSDLEAKDLFIQISFKYMDYKAYLKAVH
ncbi:HNH endonuclease [Dyadobacter arcticus]|uniref:HNH domain-containing protein n=1 Tax=Dyadobacter arcticus TaxID=1078754 RepID=A0ABX0UPF8_9BACT|nr:HNH endonuclease [Dyadobacter arcticus]NIJ54014.1 hypothetical protein [Dyadobacter arcticus]